MSTLGERVTSLEHKLEELRRLVEGAMDDPESVRAGRQAAQERREVSRRLREVERIVQSLVDWASGRRDGRRTG